MLSRSWTNENKAIAKLLSLHQRQHLHCVTFFDAFGTILQELRQRIRDSYEARWKAEKHFDEDQILNEMPGSLRIEVSHASILTAFQHTNSLCGSCHFLTVYCTLSLPAVNKCFRTCKSVTHKKNRKRKDYAFQRSFNEKPSIPGCPGQPLTSLTVLQVCMHTCAELIASVPFLEDAEDDFVRYLVTQLHPTV